MSKDIWVYAETNNGKLCDIVPELLTKGRQLKVHSDGDLVAVVLGAADEQAIGTLSEYGADKVIFGENKALEHYSARTYAQAMTALAQKYEPEIFIIPATGVGREIAPLTMQALDTGLTADALDLIYDEDGDFIQVTAGFGGNILAHICIGQKRPQMVTVCAKVFDAVPLEHAGEAEVIREAVDCAADPAYALIEAVAAEKSHAQLKDAKIVVACGRGIKKKEDLDMVAEFASRIGASLACSRPLSDCGWMPHEAQLGQSGCTVKADLIINIGISGSTQYLAGMQNSKCIVSVNTNETAPIMAISNYSIVADYRQFIPALMKKLH